MEGDQIKIEAIRNALPYEYRDIKLTDDDFVDALHSLIYDRNIPVITIMGAGGLENHSCIKSTLHASEEYYVPLQQVLRHSIWQETALRP